MARSARPASESYQPSGSSVAQAAIVGREDEDDCAPIFSLSKSSTDMVTATGLPFRRDPAWPSMDLRRSLSTNAHGDQSPATFQKLRPHTWQHRCATHSLQLPRNVDAHSERWSDGTHSRSSTPDTVVWTAGGSRPSSLSHDDSPLSKVTSPSSTPSPFVSPLCTPPVPAADTPTSPSEPEDPLGPSPGPPPVTRSSSSFASNTEDEGFLENNLLFFQFPSPVPSIVGVADGGDRCFVQKALEQLHSPGDVHPPEAAAATSPQPAPRPSAGQREERLELPWQQSCWTSPIVSSLSDSRLHDLRRVRRPETVDAAVQTVSPVCSWWDLKRNTDSGSILGSPPGSRLNLKSSVGSNSNLVSPSSSMFPASSGEEEEQPGDNPPRSTNSASSHNLERRRSCLKMIGRRSSMKQVQWDEEGVTWDAHEAPVDPEVLSTAILKHLDLQNSPQAPRKSSKKKKAPMPPLLLNAVKAIAPDLGPPVASITSACVVEGDGEGTPEADGGTGMDKDTAGAGRRVSRAEDEEVDGEEGTRRPAPSRGSGPTRKRSVIRSLRPGWCGGRRADD